MSKNKVGGSGRKKGRDKVKCALYRSSGRREKNKLRKMKKFFKKQPNNLQLQNRISELQSQV